MPTIQELRQEKTRLARQLRELQANPPKRESIRQLIANLLTIPKP